MWAFNLVVTTASGGRYRHLLHELSPLGEFRRTDFLGVILGQVAQVPVFLEQVRAERERRLIAFADLGRAVPVECVFPFHVEEFLDKAQAAIRPYLERLAGRRFYVRLERRGLKGQIVSPEAERALDGFVKAELEQAGKGAEVDFASPDAVIVVETVGDRCGVGLLTRELLERYDFVRVD
jgi:tRNA(Ser,Leu) C12 N-acetylase TAN1